MDTNIDNKKINRCKICRGDVHECFRHGVLDQYASSYLKCNSCGFLYAENPNWLSEAYRETITTTDTGLLGRNIDLSRKTAVLIYSLLAPDGNYLDYAGGYGVFTRLMRDAGFNFFHSDPYTKNLFAVGFEWDRKTRIDGITCIECFEHFSDPMQDIEKILAISKTVLFTTELLPQSVPPLSWEYYGFEHGQHISFYALQTLEYIARTHGLHLTSIRNFHLFTEKAISKAVVSKLLRKANRTPHFLAHKTTFESIAQTMRRRKSGVKT